MIHTSWNLLVLIAEMRESTPPHSSYNLLLVPEQKKLDIRKCIIYQKDKDNKGSTKLWSAENGRDKVMSISIYLEDKNFLGLSEREKAGIQYHLKTCYSTYNKSWAWEEIRQRKLDELHQPKESSSTTHWPKPSCSRPNRQKIVRKISPREKTCIICNNMTSKRDSNRHQLSGPEKAKLFLSAHNFNKDAVHPRSILYQKVEDRFATNIIYYKNCMST